MVLIYHIGLGQSDPGALQLHKSERTVLLQSQMWSLQSTSHRIKWTAALVTTLTWRRNLYKLEVALAQATMEFQVTYNPGRRIVSEFDKKMQVLGSTYRRSVACVIRKKVWLVFVLTQN